MSVVLRSVPSGRGYQQAELFELLELLCDKAKALAITMDPRYGSQRMDLNEIISLERSLEGEVI